MTFLALAVKSDPFPVCGIGKKDRETQRQCHGEMHTEDRVPGNWCHWSVSEANCPQIAESHRRRLEPVFKGPNEWHWSRNRERNEHLFLLQAGPDNKLYFHGGVAAVAGGTLMVPRGDEDLAFRTRGRRAVPIFILSPRSWEGATAA